MENTWNAFNNCKISFQLKWSKDCFLVPGTVANQVPEFKITDKKLYVPVVTLSIQDYVRLLEQLESGFRRMINRNKYQSKKQIKCKTDILSF